MRYNPIAFAAFGLMIHCPEPSCFGNALQAAGGPVRPVRIVRGKRRSSSRVPTKGGRRLKGGGGVSSSSERSFDTRTGEGVRTVAGQRKVKRSYSRGSEGVMARLRRKVGLFSLIRMLEPSFPFSLSFGVVCFRVIKMR